MIMTINLFYYCEVIYCAVLLGKTILSYESLIYRIGERRDIKLYTSPKYLKKPEIFTKNNTFLPNASKHSIILYAQQIYNRLFSEINIELKDIESNDIDILEDTNFEDILNDAINNISEVSPSNINLPTSSIKKRPIKFLENLLKAKKFHSRGSICYQNYKQTSR